MTMVENDIIGLGIVRLGIARLGIKVVSILGLGIKGLGMIQSISWIQLKVSADKIDSKIIILLP
jgi:hypothetical protein